MTSNDVMRKIDVILKYENRYIHNSACNLCKEIIKSKSFSKKVNNQILKIKTELENLSEPWGYGNNTSSPDMVAFNDIQCCLNNIYQLME